MTYSAAFTTIEQRVQDNWSATRVVYGGNAPAANDNQWMRVNVLNGAAGTASLGPSRRKYRHPGVLIAQIFTKGSVGSGAGLTLGDQFAAIFRGITVNGLVFRAATVKEVGPSGGWYQVNVEIPFSWDGVF